MIIIPPPVCFICHFSVDAGLADCLWLFAFPSCGQELVMGKLRIDSQGQIESIHIAISKLKCSLLAVSYRLSMNVDSELSLSFLVGFLFLVFFPQFFVYVCTFLQTNKIVTAVVNITADMSLVTVQFLDCSKSNLSISGIESI